jgi:integrase
VARRRKAGRRDKGDGEIEALPNGRYRARLTRTVNGKRSRGGSKTFRSREEARAWLDEHKKTGPASAGTVGGWLDEWLALHRPDVAPKTFRHDAQKVRRWLAPRLGGVRLRDLDALAVKRMLAEMAAEGHSDSERQKAGAVLRKALNAAVGLGRLPANPMTRAGGVKLPTPKRPEKKVFTPAQVLELLAAADAQGKGHVIRLWLDAGPRPGELLGLDWDDIHGAKVTIRRSLDADTHTLKNPKTRKSRRTLPLSAPTAEALKAARGTGVFVPDPRARLGRWWESQFNDEWWTPLLEAAGFAGQGYSPNTCRHTMATLLIRAGVPLKVVSERLGHEDVTTTLRSYAHVMEGDQAAAAEVMGRLLRGEG